MSVLSIVAALAQAVNLWLLSREKVVYPLIFLIYLMYGIVESWLAYRDPAQAGLWAFVALDVWGMYCALRGWRNAREV